MRDGDTFLISIVMPLYCEGDGLRSVLDAIGSHLQIPRVEFEFVLIDDGSSDCTWDVIRSLACERPNIRGVRFSRNFGKESALSAGLQHAGGHAVIVMDGDLQHPPDLIPKMVDLWMNSDVDVVDAVKAKRSSESLVRKTGSILFNYLMNRLSGFDLAGACDFKLLDRRVVDAWIQLGESKLFYRGMIAWLGFSHASLPFEVRERASGTSAWSFLRLFRLAVNALTSFSSLPVHFVTFLGMACFAASVLLGAWTLYMWVSGTAVSGFTTVILLQLIIGSALMCSLGIIGEYIASIYSEVKKRPRFVVQDTINL